jgi:energy-coupling factor transport system permease protein
MSELTLYTSRDSRLHALNPLTKLSLAGLSLLIGLSLPGIWGAYALVAFYVLPLAIWGQVAGRLYSATWRIVLPFALSVFAIQSVFWQGGTPVLHIGPVSVKLEGLQFAAASTGRILVVVTSFLLLAFVTRPDGLMIALTQRGLPPSLTYIVLSTIQIIPRFQARAQTILEAQQSRGLSLQGNLLQRGRNLLPLVVPLVLGSIVDVEQRAIALEARAFKRLGKKTSFLVLHDSPAQGYLRGFIIALIVITYLAHLATLVLR